jgi:three-Cys-motif partner protein
VTKKEFFESPAPHSKVKTEIVFKYFKAWCQVMRFRTHRLAYFDLYCGPGKFEDGEESTPLLVLRHVLGDPDLCTKVVAQFNDAKPKYAEQLSKEIDALPGIEGLQFKPLVTNQAVGSELVEALEDVQLVPSFFFIDPWGYKGLSVDLVGRAIHDWGCDCIFFFNYNRINLVLGHRNPGVNRHIDDFFGRERAAALREQVVRLKPEDRQEAIIEALLTALHEVGGTHTLKFEFESVTSARTSHYLIFVSKHFRGYDIMKKVMASVTTDTGEVKAFRWSPVRSQLRMRWSKFTIENLKKHLIQSCVGTTKTVVEIYEQNTVGTDYLLTDVQRALTELECEGKVTVDKPVSARRKLPDGRPTLGEKRLVTFPAQ